MSNDINPYFDLVRKEMPTQYFRDMQELKSDFPLKTDEGRKVHLSNNEIVALKTHLVGKRSNHKYAYYLEIAVCTLIIIILAAIFAASSDKLFVGIITVGFAVIAAYAEFLAVQNLLAVYRIENAVFTAYEFKITDKFRVPTPKSYRGSRPTHPAAILLLAAVKTAVDEVSESYTYFAEFGGNLAKVQTKKQYDALLYGAKIRCGVLTAGKKEFFTFL